DLEVDAVQDRDLLRVPAVDLAHVAHVHDGGRRRLPYRFRAHPFTLTASPSFNESGGRATSISEPARPSRRTTWPWRSPAGTTARDRTLLPSTSNTTGLPSRVATASFGTTTTGDAGSAAAAGRAASTKVTLALISGLSWASLSRIVTLTWTVAFVRSAVGITCRSTALYLRSGNASTVTSAGWSAESLATLDSLTSASTSSVSRSARATIAPEEVEMFTPGGMGATLSPTSAIFFTTVPVNGARMMVLASDACAKERSARACDTAASLTRARLSVVWRVSVDMIFSSVSRRASSSWRWLSARSACARWSAARARSTWAS